MINRYSTVILLLLGSLSLADFCTPEVNSKIQSCVQPVGDYAKMLNNNQESKAATQDFGFSFTNMGQRVFNDLCKLVTKFNDCVREHRLICPRHVTIGLIDSSYGYLCNDGHRIFLDSAECLMELDRKPEVKQCHDQTLKDIERANTEVGLGLNDKVDRMCGALNFFSSCVRQPIKTDCGSSAWQVIYRVLKDTTKTLMPGCAFGSRLSSDTSMSPPSSHHHGKSEHHHTHEGRQGRRKNQMTSSTTTSTQSSNIDFIVGTSEDNLLREHLRDSSIVSIDATSDYYHLQSSSFSFYSLFYLSIISIFILLR